MKKVPNEALLTKKAIEVGQKYALQRGYKAFAPNTSANDKVEVLYRLLVQDGLIVALPPDKEDLPNIKHKLALWIQKLLPADDDLLTS
ncbi:DUF5062 family protein [Marinomonas agarivorans]|nr:DUF5062 family protein [Marinomonas agarivorans]